MQNYSEYKALKDNQDLIVDRLSDKLQTFPKGAFGLAIRCDEFIKTNREFKIQFKILQDIHSKGMKLFKKEIQKDSMQKRFN